MPRLTLMQTSFAGGEISPRLAGRVDVARYANSAKTIENAIVTIHGGALRRNGSRFITGTKYNLKKSRLIPYIFSKTQAYMLEFGDFYMRVYKDGAQVLLAGSAYEIATPYSENMIWEIDYVQGADTMFLAHSGVPIQRLQRFADNSWVMQDAPFAIKPFDEIGFRPQVALTLSSAALGAGRTFTAASAVFLNSDIGREVWAGTGVALLTAFTSTTVVTATVTSAFQSTAIALAQWQIKDSPQGAITCSAKEPAGQTITLTSSAVSAQESAKVISGVSWASNVVTITINAHGYANGDTVVISDVTTAAVNGTFVISGVAANTFTYSLTGGTTTTNTTYNSGRAVYSSSGASTSRYGVKGNATTTAQTSPPTGTGSAAPSGSVSRSVASTARDLFRASDVGSFVRVNRGFAEITGFSNAQLVTGIIRTSMDALITAQIGAWSLESSVWNAGDGYPRAVSLCEQRLVAAGSTSYPQTIWLSRLGEYYSFEIGVNDDDAISFTISSDQINPIAHIGQVRVMVALTYGGEFTMYGGVEKAISPTNVQIKNQSNFGCNNVKPVRVGNELLFMQRANRKLRAMAYRFENDAYNAPDLTVFSEHITKSGIVDMAYQQEPESIVWMVRADGQMATLTLDRDQEVVAWSRQVTDGFYESIATIPVANGEEVWATVRRTVNGATVRYVERLTTGYQSDASIEGTSVGGAATWSGLSHLEGKEVDIVADGVVMNRKTVAGGQITLERTAKSVVIGLPFETTVEMLTPEVQTGTGSAQGNSMRISEITLRFLETTGAQLNDQIIPFRSFGLAVLDAPTPLYTGDYRIEKLGWERGVATFKIQQKQPLPFHLLGVIKKMQVND